ncbi:pentapeptide repeat-containing protein [Nocardia sp. NPDC051832]|uniref:pentapeptide repeat-containing protein n=1 Tax=Nocardia sp. NPDC051832 TaxID=3155673 RepID=UPI00342D100E
MRRFLGVPVVVFAAAVLMAGSAVAQAPSTAPTNPGWFTQPLATVLTGVLAVFAATIALGGVLLNRRQTEKHFTGKQEQDRAQFDRKHELERIEGLRKRYTSSAEQLAHASAAIRQAGVYALTALADDWHAIGEDEERQVCIDLLQWYLRVPFPQPLEGEQPDLSEREIRQTILTILTRRRHRPPEDPKSWAEVFIDLRQISLPNCTLAHLEFADLSLTGANLTDADLSDADLHGADLHGAHLGGANLHGVHLTDAELSAADLHGANLYGANLINARLVVAKLAGAHLTVADLTGANLYCVNLYRANLYGAKLAGATLGRANLGGANLKVADLTDADLTEARHNDETVWPHGFTPPADAVYEPIADL